MTKFHQAIETSSFQTLETLAAYLCQLIIEDYVIPVYRSEQKDSTDSLRDYPTVKVALEKPTAVMMADAPCVELIVDSSPDRNPDIESLWSGVGS